MIDARLTLALDGGGLAWPETGRIAVLAPSGNAQLLGLPKDRVQIIQGFKPDHDAFAARGHDCAVAPEGEYAATVLCLPRSKVEARAMIAAAVRMTSGAVVIDGQKTDGIDSILRDMRKRVSVSGPVSKAHGKLFWFDATDADQFSDWAAGPAQTDGGFWAAPGVFSADGVDLASALLADVLPSRIVGQVADLGAGWGFLSAHVATRPDVEALHLVEAHHTALECAKRNVTDPRAMFHWDDVTQWRPETQMDMVVMNPPFHVGRRAEPGLGQAFCATAARILLPRGELWMVANRHLPYEATLVTLFAKVTEIGGDNRFKLLHATRPIRTKR